MEFKTCSSNYLTPFILHAMFAMVYVLPQIEMRSNSKESLTEMNKDDLKYKIGIYKGQIDGIEVKKALDKGIDQQT